jgi:hypothetical protein
MSEAPRERAYFYLPPGTFTSFELFSIVYTSPTPVMLAVEFGDPPTTATFPAPSVESGALLWSTDDVGLFTDARTRTFTAILDSARIDVDLDRLVLVSVEGVPECPPNTLLLCFLVGYFVRESDSGIRPVKLTNVKRLTAAKRESFQKACESYRSALADFEAAFETTFAPIYERQLSNDALRRRLNVDQFAAYQESVRGTPKFGESPRDRPPPPSRIRTMVSPRSKSAKVVRPPLPVIPLDIQPAPSIFPPARLGWRAPSAAEIQMCLAELSLIFPRCVERRTFCDISEDDPDPEVQKTFLFNVIHLLVLFSELTGMVYDVRIALTDGWFRMEDRMTGLEIKREITSKTALSNPYRAAALACLRKIVAEFHIDVQPQDFFGCIDALLNFHSLIVD